MTRRRVLEKSFFNQFFKLNVDAGHEKREKFWSGLDAEQNWTVEQNESTFFSYRCFRESENLRWEKISVSERIFLLTCSFLKQSSFIFSV